ncbi:hypothetical protein GWI33_011942 [Rhynchophorus ferrugineus]|uniref:Uncharacterized protein n=1 Tax=Rhynchophorus ferrugineus TaxID=354439 RepID=A0A834MJU5_RHYFE|nr:hypothetical protein GWI33_011942 [Rhynchophorus ferrugineus]
MNEHYPPSPSAPRRLAVRNTKKHINASLREIDRRGRNGRHGKGRGRKWQAALAEDPVKNEPFFAIGIGAQEKDDKRKIVFVLYCRGVLIKWSAEAGEGSRD